MIFLLIAFLLITGLFFLWSALQNLCKLDWVQTLPPVPEPTSAEESEEEQPRLTRLGRPIEEIRLSA